MRVCVCWDNTHTHTCTLIVIKHISIATCTCVSLTPQFSDDLPEDLWLVSVGVEGEEGVLVHCHQSLDLLHLTRHLGGREGG